MRFLSVKKWCSANVFSNTRQRDVCWKICKVIKETFSLEICKLKKKLWCCSLKRVDEYKNVVCPKYYFQKKNSKYDILNHLYFGPNFVLGTALRRFSQCIFFLFFVIDQPWWPTFLPSPPLPPYHKKASYGPEFYYKFEFILCKNWGSSYKDTKTLNC